MSFSTRRWLIGNRAFQKVWRTFIQLLIWKWYYFNEYLQENQQRSIKRRIPKANIEIGLANFKQKRVRLQDLQTSRHPSDQSKHLPNFEGVPTSNKRILNNNKAFQHRKNQINGKTFYRRFLRIRRLMEWSIDKIQSFYCPSLSRGIFYDI